MDAQDDAMSCAVEPPVVQVLDLDAMSSHRDEAASEACVGKAAAPCIGAVRCGGRPHTLRYMPQAPQGCGSVGFGQSHPRCQFCGGPARPSVLMFNDGGWQDTYSQQQRWDAWTLAVQKLIEIDSLAGCKSGPLKVAILEIGAGADVSTVRSTSEEYLRTFNEAGGHVRLVRINPDFPFGDRADFAPGGVLEPLVLSIMSTGLESINKINSALPPGIRFESDRNHYA
eukprot:gnl/MRDRNA2_/MRDRNA2_241828_c0_seq1.p1 gnl/MRDRNA2_/MRDRNA2_241828_c0~~gnl/MRDRNA2_/MRDRNA2_241828_c0_seq1.p1  ORF type:complete len:253 (-),score=38.55 gnl/MRDRNA2_/MRDRNA2_241828_c0_seq1:173-853(-)